MQNFHNRDVSIRYRIAGNVKSNNTEQHVGAEGRDDILIFAVHRGQFSVLRFDLRSPSHRLSCIVSFTTKKKKTCSVYDCTVEDVEYICNSNSTLCLFYFAIFVVLLLS